MRRIDRIRAELEAAEQLLDRQTENVQLLRSLVRNQRWLLERATFVDEDEVDTDDLVVP